MAGLFIIVFFTLCANISSVLSKGGSAMEAMEAMELFIIILLLLSFLFLGIFLLVANRSSLSARMLKEVKVVTKGWHIIPKDCAYFVGLEIQEAEGETITASIGKEKYDKLQLSKTYMVELYKKDDGPWQVGTIFPPHSDNDHNNNFFMYRRNRLI
ncbi:MAG: hypothetical protein WDZ40_01865 [Candidatus Spechtbacterales bacterium]